jgi:hypothetical protein
LAGFQVSIIGRFWVSTEEIGVELPLRLEPIHVITTDDPVGVETYWHRRFAEKRLKNEWFALSPDDVRAFKRWRRIA